MSIKFWLALTAWFGLVAFMLEDRAYILRVLVPISALFLTAYLVWAAVSQIRERKEADRKKRIDEILKGDL